MEVVVVYYEVLSRHIFTRAE